MQSADLIAFHGHPVVLHEAASKQQGGLGNGGDALELGSGHSIGHKNRSFVGGVETATIGSARGGASHPRRTETELPTLKPWYETDAAREILAACVETPPKLHEGNSQAMQAGENHRFYDPADRRVILLRATLDVYYEAIAQAKPELLRATRFDIGVTEAIDLAIEAAKNAAATGTLRDSLLAQGLTLGEVNRLVAAAEAEKSA